MCPHNTSSTPIGPSDTAASLKNESLKFRCAKSGRLLSEPALGSDGRYYEYTVLEVLIGADLPSSANVERDPQLKEQVQKFAIKALKQLENYISHRGESEVILPLVGDCLSVFNPAENFDLFAHVLEKISKEQLQFLIRFISDIVHPSILRILLNVTRQHREFYAQALEMSRFFLIEARHPEFYDSDFENFLELLKSNGINSEAFRLGLEAANTCKTSQLSQLREILAAGSSREDKNSLIELNFLSLKEEGCSAKLIETLSLLHQMNLGKTDNVRSLQISDTLEAFRAKLYRLDADIEKLTAYKVADSETLKLGKRDFDISHAQYTFSYQGGTSNLHDTNLSTGRDSTHTVPFQFKIGCSWCPLPGGSLCFSGDSTLLQTK